MANQAGQRMKCEKCGSEIVLTKGGDGDITCCEQAMAAK